MAFRRHRLTGRGDTRSGCRLSRDTLDFLATAGSANAYPYTYSFVEQGGAQSCGKACGKTWVSTRTALVAQTRCFGSAEPCLGDRGPIESMACSMGMFPVCIDLRLSTAPTELRGDDAEEYITETVLS